MIYPSVISSSWKIPRRIAAGHGDGEHPRNSAETWQPRMGNHQQWDSTWDRKKKLIHPIITGNPSIMGMFTPMLGMTIPFCGEYTPCFDHSTCVYIYICVCVCNVM